MQPVHVLGAMASLLTMSAACGGGTPATPATAGDASATTATATSAAATTGSAARQREVEDFDPRNFDRSAEIDNEWFPLTPGTRFVYEGAAVENGKRVPHRVVFTVTDLTKMINGVRAVVIADKDYSDGQLIESELTFFAQDRERNVWHLGQYRETYDEMEFVGGRVWLDGYLEGAKAGIMMPAEPRLGTPSYSEGYAPAPFNWTDRGRVYQVGQKTRVPVGSYDDVLVIEEFNQEEPNAFQLKYYARNVGIVRVGWRGDDQSEETLQLVERVQLDQEALARARADALELEKRAYIYARTPPAERSGDLAQGSGQP
jgi:hypothetical protein